MLHAEMNNLFGHDATFMTGWNAGRRVGLKEALRDPDVCV